MDREELTTRLKELAGAAGIPLIVEKACPRTHVSEDRCWVDGHERCPYGLPEGQYQLRPNCCNRSCRVWLEHNPDFGFTEDDVMDRATDIFERDSVTLSSQLDTAAEAFNEGSPEQLALTLARDIIEADKELNIRILIEADVPKK